MYSWVGHLATVFMGNMLLNWTSVTNYAIHITSVCFPRGVHGSVWVCACRISVFVELFLYQNVMGSRSWLCGRCLCSRRSSVFLLSTASVLHWVPALLIKAHSWHSQSKAYICNILILRNILLMYVFVCLLILNPSKSATCMWTI